MILSLLNFFINAHQLIRKFLYNPEIFHNMPIIVPNINIYKINRFLEINNSGQILVKINGITDEEIE